MREHAASLDAVELDAADASDMLDPVTRARPGPFRPAAHP